MDSTYPIRTIIKNIVLVIIALAILLPVWLLFVSSFRESTTILTYPPKLWPSDGSFENYIQLFSGNSYYLRWFFNSVFVCTLSVVLMLIVCTMAGYAFAKKQFVGKRFWLILILSTTMIPGIVTIIPSFLIVDKLGWTNTYMGLIIPTIPSAFGVFMMTQFIRVIPRELTEAAKIDGCGEYKAFFKIIVPIVQPSLGVLAIFHFISNWGNLLWPLIITTEEKMKTLPVGIAGMKAYGESSSGDMMAATFLSFIPLFLVFLFAREKFIEGVTAGSVKG